jgi:DNA-binding CsgD family transcriptional regulator
MIEKLSPAELRVIEVIHLPNKEICRILKIKDRTVLEHCRSIHYKLGVHSKTEAAMWWHKQTHDCKRKERCDK